MPVASQNLHIDIDGYVALKASMAMLIDGLGQVEAAFVGVAALVVPARAVAEASRNCCSGHVNIVLIKHSSTGLLTVAPRFDFAAGSAWVQPSQATKNCWAFGC